MRANDLPAGDGFGVRRQSGMDEATLIGHLKEIGRGRKAAGDLTREDAQALFAAMLGGRVPDLQLGGVLIALRVKGESLAELAGFAAACEASYAHIPPFALSLSKDEQPIPIVIPSYNGARQLPNLVPLLALLLAKAGIPVLVHGVVTDAGRITTREVFAEMGIAPAGSTHEAREQLASAGVSFLPIDVLAPRIANLLALRRRLGVRNSAHTLAKMLQPFAGPAVRIVSVTHPDYLVRMREFFTQHDTGALLLRGAEGEAVAHPRRDPVMEWAYGSEVATWAAPVRPSTGSGRTEPELPQKDAGVTARWIESVLAGKTPVPEPIRHQVECCRRAVSSLRATT
jgi:anthranilate phosphoribosyltransferase